jgi:hypothetical protein
MEAIRERDTGRLALLTGAVAAGSIVCLGTFFAVGGPFGTINDVGNAATGVLSGLLAWRLRHHVAGTLGAAAVIAAVVGAGITVVGSGLVISGTTGFMFAGLVSSVGFAGIGAWLVVLNSSRDRVAAWPGRLRAVGAMAGALMAFGIVTLPGIPMRLDDIDTAPGWVWLGMVGWLGTYVVYPAWAIAMGMLETRRASTRLPAGTVTE